MYKAAGCNDEAASFLDGNYFCMERSEDEVSDLYGVYENRI